MPQPEFLGNVQQCSKAVYMRSAEAAQCKVRSVLVLPVFSDRERAAPVGVLEVAQSTETMPSGNVVKALTTALEVSLPQIMANHRQAPFIPSLVQVKVKVL